MCTKRLVASIGRLHRKREPREAGPLLRPRSLRPRLKRWPRHDGTSIALFSGGIGLAFRRFPGFFAVRRFFTPLFGAGYPYIQRVTQPASASLFRVADLAEANHTMKELARTAVRLFGCTFFIMFPIR